MAWERLKLAFAGYPAREKIARKMLELGLRARDGKVYCGDVEVKDVSLAKACGVDRRAVTATLKTISSDPLLRNVFANLEPAGPFLLHNASALGLHVIEIEPPDARRAGIIAEVARVLAESRVSMRQILSQNPSLFENPKLFMVLDKQPPARVLQRLSALKTVKKLSVY